jgi:hypothetical protein
MVDEIFEIRIRFGRDIRLVNIFMPPTQHVVPAANVQEVYTVYYMILNFPYPAVNIGPLSYLEM